MWVFPNEPPPCDPPPCDPIFHRFHGEKKDWAMVAFFTLSCHRIKHRLQQKREGFGGNSKQHFRNIFCVSPEKNAVTSKDPWRSMKIHGDEHSSLPPLFSIIFVLHSGHPVSVIKAFITPMNPPPPATLTPPILCNPQMTVTPPPLPKKTSSLKAKGGGSVNGTFLWTPRGLGYLGGAR